MVLGDVFEGQRNMQTRRGSNNAQTLFGIEDIPCDSHIRNILDPLEPEFIVPQDGTEKQDCEINAATVSTRGAA
ncbi:MAG: hypothetical protein ACI8QF_003697 [Limisphaerales bacterium]|jgi:hypothetical protein